MWLFLSAEKIYSLKFFGYHYQRNIIKNEIHCNNVDFSMSDAVMKAENLLIQKKIYTQNKKIFEDWAFFQCKEYENVVKHALASGRISDSEYFTQILSSYSALDTLSPQWRKIEDNQFLVFGSYSIRSIINYILLDLQRIRHYQFSSPAAAFSQRLENIEPWQHTSSFRKTMLDHVAACDFARAVSDRGQQADFLCLDLLEERFPLLDCGSAGYLTKSDALDESLAAFPRNLAARLLERGRADTEEIWQTSCLEAIAQFKQRFHPSHVILVKVYLAEYYGEYGKEYMFDNVEEIRRSNAVIRECYTFFEENFAGIHNIDIPNNLLFSDTSFKHGCAPWHLNDFCYYALADSIRQYILNMDEINHK
jgi:hypothetical protein